MADRRKIDDATFAILIVFHPDHKSAERAVLVVIWRRGSLIFQGIGGML